MRALLAAAALLAVPLAARAKDSADRLVSTGGRAIDAAGTLYSSDTDHLRILKIAPDGAISTLVATPSSTGSTPCGSTTPGTC